MTSEVLEKEEPNRNPDIPQIPQEGDISKEDNNQILIKNIPETATEEGLRNIFEKFGKITKIQINKDIGEKPADMAIIEFEEKKVKDSVLNSKEDFELEGNKLEIKDQIMDNRTLFVGNIPYTSTEKDIADFFSDCGQVYVKFFYINEKFKGYAHVTFQDDNAVETALKKNGETIEGREIKIDSLKPKNILQSQREGRRMGYHSRGRGRGRPSFGHFDRERKDDYFRDRRMGDRSWDRGRPYNNRMRERERDRDREWNRDRRERSRDGSREYNAMRDRDRDRGERDRKDRERGDRDRNYRERGNRERNYRDRGDRDRNYRDRGDRDRNDRERSEREREREGDRHREMERGDRDRERRHSNYEKDNGYRERD